MVENILKSATIKTDAGEFVIKVEYDEPHESPREWDDTNASNMICFHSRYTLGDEHNFSDNVEFLADLINDNKSHFELWDILEPHFKKHYTNLRYELHEYDEKEYYVVYEKNNEKIKYDSFEVDSHDSVVVLDCYREIYDEMMEEFITDFKDFLTISDMLEIIENHTEVVLLPLYLYDHSGITMNTTGFSCRWDSGQVGYIYATKESYEKHYGGSWTVERITEDLRAEVSTYDTYLRGEIYWFKVEKAVKCECCNHVEYDEIDSCGGFYDMESLIDHVQFSFDKKYHDEINKILK